MYTFIHAWLKSGRDIYPASYKWQNRHQLHNTNNNGWLVGIQKRLPSFVQVQHTLLGRPPSFKERDARIKKVGESGIQKAAGSKYMNLAHAHYDHVSLAVSCEQILLKRYIQIR